MSVATTRVRINIVLTGGYALCAVLVLASAYLLTLGFPEWISYFQWGVGLAVFFTVTWAILKVLIG